jgi:hypothetical protein
MEEAQNTAGKPLFDSTVHDWKTDDESFVEKSRANTGMTMHLPDPL